ncbi:MAG: NAD(P)-binding domain-containing protein [Cyanobacteria bacterium SZAS LIN-2]|nr:NAD(P)-binding domain-containing protein [Cyanobacteria bacterium SZAS LIN-3]MBS1997292.1 NAD(P)-binding domain-containing protein [Cyanobacteria bacterium SZAS LIN-2]
MHIVVVGGGMQGRVIAKNLLERAEKPHVVIADIHHPDSLPAGAHFIKADILDLAAAKMLAEKADAFVLAVPSSIAHQALSNLIDAGKPVVDVSFTPNPPLDLDARAKHSGAVCLVDCGIAPGLSHILVGAAHAEFGGLDKATIWVGGMPQKPAPGFHHAIYFNPHDLIAEYVRPARARKAGKDIAPAPMDVPFEDFTDSDDLGKLQAFLSDGLRSLLDSYPDVPEMAELTLRWPGHLDAMKSLHQMGLLEDENVARPLAERLNFNFSADMYPDVLLMVVEASKGKQSKRWRLIDRRHNEESAMSRTTGYTTAAVAMVLARGEFTEAGVFPPEKLGQNPKLVATILADLADHGVLTSEAALAH